MSAPLDAWALPPGVELSGAVQERAPGPGGGSLRWLYPEATAFGGLLDHLEQAGEALRSVPVRQVAAALGRVGARFLDPGDSLRTEALARLPAQAGVSPGQARWILDNMAADWTPARLATLLEAELGGPDVLDGFRRRSGDPAVRRVRALGPRLALHVTAGTVPGVSVTSLLRGLLVKGSVLMKPGAGDALLPVLFARGLAEGEGAARAVASALAVVYWPGGTVELEDAALARADQVVVYGADDTVAELRRRTRAHARVVAYPHRVSVAVLGAGARAGDALKEAAAALARAVASFDQRGCVSPHQLLLPGATPAEAGSVAGALAASLEELSRELPPGPLEPAEAAAVQQLRGAAELRAAAGDGTTLHAGPGLAWTVVLEPRPRFRPSCLARTVHVTAVDSGQELLRVLAPVADHLQTVGVAGLDREAAAELAEGLARLGAARVVPLRAVAFPPPWWLHDGRGPLTELVRWAEWEG